MDMKEFKELPENKFLIVLGKMYASVFGQIEKHIKSMGYNSTEFLILYAIAANGALTIQDIAARIAMTSGNMTYTIDKLEKRGMVKRVRCPEDRRKIYIDFTTAGKEKWSALMIEHTEYLQASFNAIDGEILIQVIDGMKTIGKNINTNNY